MAASWTIAPADYADVVALAAELGISEVTAGILVRRGYREAGEARAFLAPEERPGHDPLLLGDMEVAVARLRAAVAAGEKICVHGDYDVDGVCATTARGAHPARARRRRHVAPAEPLRGRLRRLRRHHRAAGRGRHRPAAHRRLRHHRRRRGGRGAAARRRRDRHGSPPPRRNAARLPHRRDPAVGLPLPRARAAPASSTSSPRPCSGPSIPLSSATSTSSPSPRSRTWFP